MTSGAFARFSKPLGNRDEQQEDRSSHSRPTIPYEALKILYNCFLASSKFVKPNSTEDGFHRNAPNLAELNRLLSDLDELHLYVESSFTDLATCHYIEFGQR